MTYPVASIDPNVRLIVGEAKPELCGMETRCQEDNGASKYAPGLV